MIWAGIFIGVWQKVRNSIRITRPFVARCRSLAAVDPLGRINKPDQIFNDQSSDAITMYAPLLTKLSSGAASAPQAFRWLIVFS